MPAIELSSFVQHFAEQFENTDPALITETTEFRTLKEWDSLIALSLIAMADEEYEVKLTGDDIRTSKTVVDIYEKIKSKLT